MAAGGMRAEGQSMGEEEAQLTSTGEQHDDHGARGAARYAEPLPHQVCQYRSPPEEL